MTQADPLLISAPEPEGWEHELALHEAQMQRVEALERWMAERAHVLMIEDERLT